MFHVYVIRSCSTGRFYIGHTDNLQERLYQHNRGYSASTKRHSDWSVIYEETYPNRALAMKREKFLKSGRGKEVLKLKGIV